MKSRNDLTESLTKIRLDMHNKDKELLKIGQAFCAKYLTELNRYAFTSGSKITFSSFHNVAGNISISFYKSDYGVQHNALLSIILDNDALEKYIAENKDKRLIPLRRQVEEASMKLAIAQKKLNDLKAV